MTIGQKRRETNIKVDGVDYKQKEQIRQKLRLDRLAAKKYRVEKMKERLKQLVSTNKAQRKVRAKIASILHQKARKEQLMSSQEYRQMYQQNYSGQNDGNIMHTPSLFTSKDGREHAIKTGGNILHAPNYLLQQRKGRYRGGSIL